jgi:integrase
MAEHHELMGGKLHVYKRENSNLWQASTYLGGKNRRISTKEESLSHAKEIAEDWYLELRGKSRAGLLKSGKLFRDVSKHFLVEYVTLIEGERNANYVRGYRDKIRVHLDPFFGKKVLSEVTSGLVQEYRVHRAGCKTQMGRAPTRSTLHQEIVVLRQVLKFANRNGWLDHVPDLSPAYKASGKITHRAWFSPEEYKTLYEATRQRALNPKKKNRYKWVCEQLHDFVLFMANTGLRPDEAGKLQFRDVSVVKDAATKETILEIEVRGKRGVGFCKSTAKAVLPFERLQKRFRLKPKGSSASKDQPTVSAGPLKATPATELVLPGPTDLLFPKLPRELLNAVLEETGLKHDREGKERTSYSLRHTYICFRLMEGADIYQIAKNCRTSVEMIEKFYAAHIKNTLDAAAINMMKGNIARDSKKEKSKAKAQSQKGTGSENVMA